MTRRLLFATLIIVEIPKAADLKSGGPEETIAIGNRIGRLLPPGSVVLLIGPLGSGKTVMAKGIARGMDIREEIISPTYTIIAEYPGEKPLHHVDLYRVEGREQMENLGLDDILWTDGVSIVEWGEKLETDFPRPPIRITLSIDSETERTITVEGLSI